MAVGIKQISELREETGAGIMAVKKALEEAGGEVKKAKWLLRERGLKKAEKKATKEAEQGIIEAYIHHGGRIVGLVELNCETDFVAKTEAFRQLAHELAMQVASMKPKDISELMEQAYIREPKIKVKELVGEAVGRLGEKIMVRRMVRWELGEPR